MNELLKKRLDRKLESLADERVYQVLDYIEFLESKYAERAPVQPSAFERLAESVEDTLRAGRVMSGLAAAGKAVVDEVAGGKPAAPQADKAAPEDTSKTA